MLFQLLYHVERTLKWNPVSTFLIIFSPVCLTNRLVDCRFGKYCELSYIYISYYHLCLCRDVCFEKTKNTLFKQDHNLPLSKTYEVSLLVWMLTLSFFFLNWQLQYILPILSHNNSIKHLSWEKNFLCMWLFPFSFHDSVSYCLHWMHSVAVSKWSERDYWEQVKREKSRRGNFKTIKLWLSNGQGMNFPAVRLWLKYM